MSNRLQKHAAVCRIEAALGSCTRTPDCSSSSATSTHRSTCASRAMSRGCTRKREPGRSKVWLARLVAWPWLSRDGNGTTNLSFCCVWGAKMLSKFTARWDCQVASCLCIALEMSPNLLHQVFVILGFTGIDQAYEEPARAEIEISAGEKTLDECVQQVIQLLQEKVSHATPSSAPCRDFKRKKHHVVGESSLTRCRVLDLSYQSRFLHTDEFHHCSVCLKQNFVFRYIFARVFV